MPEVTAGTKIVLGSVAAACALITGLLGNVLAANITAFFSGTPPKTGKRPAILWAAFFVSASLSVVAGSITTFAPTAPAAAGAGQPKIVVTNVSGSMLAQNTRNLFVVCRDTVELANTSDIPTSVVAVGTQLDVDGTLLKLDPDEKPASASAGQVSAMVTPWLSAPEAKVYAKLKTLEQFGAVSGGPLPIKIEARSTVAVYIDYALKLASAMPQSISARHVLRFPDIQDVQTESMPCQ